MLDRTRNVGVGGAGSPISFLFDDPKGDLGTTHTYTAGTPSLSVIASGFSGNNSPVGLFGKNAGSGEQGLGLVNEPQSNGGTSEHEITKGSFIQLDVSGLFGNITSMSAKSSFDSTTGNEEYLVYGSNTSSTLGTTPLAWGGDENPHSLPSFGTYKYYDFGSGKGNVLLVTSPPTSLFRSQPAWRWSEPGCLAWATSAAAMSAAETTPSQVG